MDQIVRDKEPADPARAARVKEILDEIEADLKHWEWDFDRMRLNRRFARGLQWPGMTRQDLKDPDRRYVENITLRHIRQRVASVYARNPKFNWRRRRRLFNRVWDGTPDTLQQATQTFVGDAALGIPPNPTDPYAMAVLQEAAAYAEQTKQLQAFGDTLTILYEYYLSEQVNPFKKMMKRLVTQAFTCGVAYVKQDFQRIMQPDPDIQRQIADASSQLERINQLSQDLQQEQPDPSDARVDELKTLLQTLESAEQILLREGLVLDWPDPLNIIPSREMQSLASFLSQPHCTERYYLSHDRVKQVYGVDLGSSWRPHRAMDAGNAKGGERSTYSPVKNGEKPKDDDCACVYVRYNRVLGLVEVVCDGYDDYLQEPAPPSVYRERFYPWFVLCPNDLDDPENPFAPSDVELIEPMQREINRAGEAKRDHRYAARPGHVTSASIDPEDATKIGSRAAHQVIPLKGMEPGTDVRAVLQPFPASPIDQNLYETQTLMTSVMRTVGTQQAQLGPTSGATATESSIAAASAESGDDSVIDDLDDLLAEMARDGGQILRKNVTEETVARIVGPGYVWLPPDTQSVADEIELEVEAGSSGRKNQAAEVNVRTQIYPLLQQIPGVKPARMAQDLLRVMDPRMELADWMDPALPSIVAANSMTQAQPAPGDPATDPQAQGPQGASNAPQQGVPGRQGPAQPQEQSPPA